MTSKHDHKKSAFPQSVTSFNETGWETCPMEGMSKREYYAARAMQAIVGTYKSPPTTAEIPVIVAAAVKIADQLLIALGEG